MNHKSNENEISVSNFGPTRKKSIKWTKKGPFFLKRGTKKGPILLKRGTISTAKDNYQKPAGGPAGGWPAERG